ncbi:MAG: 2-amino-4-hydroxy-6-hydroxymethyldihydropteridine diphosphokinase [Treponema sp.]|nr:2-amino-4-hydroxy-6-hydroxymethyldihydropteridine diphosphokinase [Treponema sp.]
MQNIVLGLGSNRSYGGKSPIELLSSACSELSLRVQDMKISSIYKTKALYLTEQDDFYNMVVAGKFEGSAYELLEFIHSVENRHGRNRSKEVRNGPRPLDIDIELFGEQVIHEKDLIVPHERLEERAFVLVPLVEILPSYAEKYKDALKNVSDQRIELVG